MRSRRRRAAAPGWAPLVLLLALAAATASCGPGPGATAGAAGGMTRTGPRFAPDARARAGAEVFRREHCARCHTLFESPPQSGPVVLPAPYEPRLFGSRVGPDLGARGHSHSDDWQLAHLYAPALLVPGSRMPAARNLFAPAAGGAPRPTSAALDLVAFLQALGRDGRDIWAEFRRREPDVPPPPAMARERLLKIGDRLYERHCRSCHGADGDGRGDAAPLLRVPPRDFRAARYRFRSTPIGEPVADADLFRTITLGTGIGSAMPSFRHLAAADRWALVLRIEDFSPALKGRKLKGIEPGGMGIPPPGSVAAVEEGRRWWRNLGCAACHGDGGRGLDRLDGAFEWRDQAGGAVPRSGDLTHACALRGGASRAALGRAVLYGVGDAMPAYEGTLAPAELGALLDFLQSLQSPAGAGGTAAATAPGTRSRP